MFAFDSPAVVNPIARLVSPANGTPPVQLPGSDQSPSSGPCQMCTSAPAGAAHAQRARSATTTPHVPRRGAVRIPHLNTERLERQASR